MKNVLKLSLPVVYVMPSTQHPTSPQLGENDTLSTVIPVGSICSAADVVCSSQRYTRGSTGITSGFDTFTPNTRGGSA
eukprot:253334-Rhodomonas_salina.1